MTATLDRKPLGQLLVSRGLLQTAQVDRALDEQRRGNNQKLLGEILIEQRLCSNEQVIESLAFAYGIPFVRATPRLADPKAVALLPIEFLRRNSVLPMFCVEGMLTVALTEPENLFLVEEIERRCRLRVQIVAATSRDIQSTLEAYLPSDCAFVVDDAMTDLELGAFRLLESPSASRASQLPVDPPVAKLTDYCIYTAIRQRASEIHIEPGDNELRIRFRIDGRLVQRLRPPGRMHAPLIARLKSLAGMPSMDAAVSCEGVMRAVVHGINYTLQIVALRGRAGEKLVLQIADDNRAPLKLEKLGFSYDMLKQWRKLLNCSAGLVIVCGPAGSGKRSVLYSSLMERNTEDCNICTVEDRFDQALPGVNQFIARRAEGIDFPATLRSVLQHEPDILMLSDLDDPRTARLATQAALGGKLVLTAMHAGDPVSAISRLIHLGLEPHLLGSTLQGVLARRLVRRLCPNCKTAYEPTSAQKRQLEPRGVGLTTLYRARGCDRCHNLGFSGQIGIHELLIPDDSLRKRISAGATLADLRALSRPHGYKSLRADGLEKAHAGTTTPEEVFRVTA